MELLFYLFEDQVWLKSINSRAERHGRNSAITGGKKKKNHLITFSTSSNYCKQTNTAEKGHTETLQQHRATPPNPSRADFLGVRQQGHSHLQHAAASDVQTGRAVRKANHQDQSANSVATLCAKTETAQPPPQGLLFFVCACDQINSFTEWVQKFSCCIPRIDPKFCHLA